MNAHSCGRGRLACYATAGLLLIAGCSRSDVRLGQVTGKVTFNGRPVPAEIIFEPVSDDDDTKFNGRPSTALADERGEFELRYSPRSSGAQVGRHRVTIIIPTPATAGGGRSATEVGAVRTQFIRHVGEGRNDPMTFAIGY